MGDRVAPGGKRPHLREDPGLGGVQRVLLDDQPARGDEGKEEAHDGVGDAGGLGGVDDQHRDGAAGPGLALDQTAVQGDPVGPGREVGRCQR